MEFDWYCTGAIGKQQSCGGVLWFSKRPQVSPLEKQWNWQHDIWCLITNTWANRVAMVSSVITRYLPLAKHGWSPFNLQIYLCSMFQVIVLVASLPVIVYQFSFDSHSFDSVLFCSTIHCSITRLFSVIFCSDTGIVFQVFRSYKPIKTTIQQVNKHHTQDCAMIFCLSSGSESLLPS
jgi:hypothetical protein